MMRKGSFVCPIPFGKNDTVQLSHGGGGRMMHQLIKSIFLSKFDAAAVGKRHDAAIIPLNGQRLAFTTDSYVIEALFFPGGDIGSLAVYGTVNDLAMCGARPRYLSAAFILEEGFPISRLQDVVTSMQQAAEGVGLEIITGDTKVIDRNKGDGLFINTTGIGLIEHTQEIEPAQVRPGDQILLSGDIGRHGITIMAIREGLSFETTIESDLAPLSELVQALLEADIEIHCLCDLTRGGLSRSLSDLG